MKKTKGFISHIEGMRALAVLAVFLNHIEHSWLPGGYLGVVGKDIIAKLFIC